MRVVLRDGEPWFVAADVCRVLEIGNSRDAVARLDEDERDGVGITDTIGRRQEMTVISESGLYALIFTSRKDAAKRFRKWITAEVIPAIRRTGRYEMPQAVPAAEDAPVETLAGLTIREAELWLQMVREARLTRGTRTAAAIWAKSPLPPLEAPRALMPRATVEDGAACLAHILNHAVDGATVELWLLDAARGIEAAAEVLTGLGLRLVPAGLFVANGTVPGLRALFAGTRWAEGAHRAALLALPGALASINNTRMQGQAVRGVILPADLVAPLATGGDDA